jgi:hypothetical protein
MTLVSWNNALSPTAMALLVSPDELDSDYEGQRWEDFFDRYYCDDYANALHRLVQDHRISACYCYLPRG